MFAKLVEAVEQHAETSRRVQVRHLELKYVEVEEKELELLRECCERMRIVYELEMVE